MRKAMVAGAAGLGLAAAVAVGGVAVASGGEDGHDKGDHEGHVTGTKADQATAAALKATDGGKANSVERDSENGATWEVEVTRPDSTTVDVRLDEGYHVVVIESDGEQG